MLWIKAWHIIFMVTWFAGLFYLPRLFVYHALSEDTSSRERFKIMEHKLLYAIMTPGAVMTLVMGLWLWLGYPDLYAHAKWIHVKVLLVSGLMIYHVYCWYFVGVFQRDQNTRSHVFYRWFNEIPVLFLIAIVILVVVKPFG